MKHMLFPELDQLSQALSHSSQECTVHTRIEAYSCKPVKRDKKLTRAMETTFQEVQAEIKQSVGSPDEDDTTDALFASPFGHLNRPQSRKTLYLLIQLLNLAFPDYDFSEVKSDCFHKESNGLSVLQALSTTLESVRTQAGPHLVYAPRSYSAYPPSSSDYFSSSSPEPPSSFPKPSHVHSMSSSPTDSLRPPSDLSRSISPVQPVQQHHHLSSGLHPMLYQVLDKVISLDGCDVYAYTPDLESDPHAEDSDSDTESEDDSSTSEDDSYDFVGGAGLDDIPPLSSPPKMGKAIINKSPYGSWIDEDPLAHSHHSASSFGRTRRTTGGLLWSSHHFFYNRKLKRILFVSMWAKKRRRLSAGFELEDGEEESFVGWHGGIGAGARAMGLAARSEDL